jgi:hypothetical protein
MTGRCAKWALLAAAIAAGPAARAQNSPWQQPEHLRGFVPRGFATDGTSPGTGKGPKPKLVSTTPSPPPQSAAVQPVVHVSPAARLTNLPRMPHGYQDPTHPVGPAEPGCAAGLRFGPYIAGSALPRR